MATATTETALKEVASSKRTQINDVVIKVATVNGSGSQSANMILVRSIFTMGVPVCGKNLFPSNIQGLPTWYVLRANQEHHLGFKAAVDVFVAMNPATLAEDIASMRPGSILLLDSAFEGMVDRTDILVYSAPFGEIVKDVCEEPRRRKMVVNILYVGILASVLGIDLEDVQGAVDWQFAKKKTAAELNKDAVRVGFEWAEKNLEKQDKFKFERAEKSKGKVLIEGNECVAIGLMFGGVTVASWYPITPSSSVCEALTTYLDKYRKDKETGKTTYAVIQSEDELAAMAMVVGAGWAGARAVTATSGPGLSLMAELAGLSYFAEIPAVIVDVMRMGPSTGLPTRNSQGDLAAAYQLSHGDCKHVVLIPGTMQECYEFAMQSLDLAEQLQTLVILLSDLDMGMNRWVTDPLEYPKEPMKRGKVLSAEDLEHHKDFARYRDVDGDGICYRTRPGTNHPDAAYFTRGTGHNEKGVYSENAEIWENLIDRLTRKYETAKSYVPEPIVHATPGGAEVGIIAFGSSDPAVHEATHLLADQGDMPVDYMRIRALPIRDEVATFLKEHRVVYVVEQNRDGQLAGILAMELPQEAHKLRKVLHKNGLPIDAETVADKILKMESE